MDIDGLMARMTLDEKLAQLGGVWVTELVDRVTFDPEAARRTMPHGIGHVTRIGASTSFHPHESAVLMNNDPEMRFVVEPGTFTFRIDDLVASVDLLGDVFETHQRDIVRTRAQITDAGR